MSEEQFPQMKVQIVKEQLKNLKKKSETALIRHCTHRQIQHLSSSKKSVF